MCVRRRWIFRVFLRSFVVFRTRPLARICVCVSVASVRFGFGSAVVFNQFVLFSWNRASCNLYGAPCFSSTFFFSSLLVFSPNESLNQCVGSRDNSAHISDCERRKKWWKKKQIRIDCVLGTSDIGCAAALCGTRVAEHVATKNCNWVAPRNYIILISIRLSCIDDIHPAAAAKSIIVCTKSCEF